eukprot:m.181338 g.181338  ORF g.181338 m.181338 type:complete len:603 (+) comp16870_c0_seq9:129-1937(+)
MRVENLIGTPIHGTCNVLLTWAPPKAEGKAAFMHALEYRVEIRSEAKPARPWRIAFPPTKDVFSCVVSDLRPYTLYEMRVVGRTIAAATDGPEALIVIRTNPMPPSDAPTNLRITHVSEDLITVAWDPPSIPNGPIIAYKLFFDQDGQEEYTEANLPPSMTSYDAKYLLAGTTYRFQLLGVTMAGEGPHSNILLQSTRLNAVKRFERQQSGVLVEDRDGESVAGSISGRDQVDVRVRVTSPLLDQQRKLSPQPLRRGSFTIVAPARRGSSTSATTMAAVTEDLPSASIEDSIEGTVERQIEEQSPPLDETSNAKSPVHRKSSLSIMAPIASKSGPKTGVAGHRASFEARGGAPRRVSKDQDWQRTVQRSSQRTIERTPLDIASMHLTTGVGLASSPQVQRTATKDPSLLDIKSAAGTVRGKRRGVRSKLQVFSDRGQLLQDPLLAALYEAERAGKVVVYVTGMAAIRETYQRCEDIKKMFYNMRIKVNIKDISLDAATHEELKKRTNNPQPAVPQVFVNGHHFGDYAKVQKLNETGELKALLQGFEERPSQDCSRCGGRGFVNCSWCQGTKRSVANPYAKTTQGALRCTVCNEIGLERCNDC